MVFSKSDTDRKPCLNQPNRSPINFLFHFHRFGNKKTLLAGWRTLYGVWNSRAQNSSAN